MNGLETTVTLSGAQMMQAALTGVMRQVSNLKHGRKPRYGADDAADWQLHIEGCMGEMAVAAVLGIFWDGKLHDLSPGDVAAIEVRTRRHDWHDLILHPQDDDNARFILVTGGNGCYVLKGWCFGYEGKRDEHWKDPARGRPAYFVPAEVLHDFASLAEHLGRGGGDG